jgi:hypothetical protein
MSNDRIPWAQDAPLAQKVRDTSDGDLEVPLHPAAEWFWQERGYISTNKDKFRPTFSEKACLCLSGEKWFSIATGNRYGTLAAIIGH